MEPGSLTSLTAWELRSAFARREASPVELIDEVGARIEASEPLLHAWTTTALDEARAQARAAAHAWLHGTPRPLEGLPLAVKDLFDTEGLRTTYGSRVFAGHVPAADAAAVRLAKQAGAIVVGKAATDEFAYGIAGVNPHQGPSRNPWQPERVSGGSSSGCGVALAARQVPLALGSDTGGSIRSPAAFCGVVGFKGTWGAVPTAGMWPMARTLDHAGPMARTPADAALLLGSIAAGHRGRGIAAAVAAGLPAVPRPLRIGTCADLVPVAPTPDVARTLASALEALRDCGASVREVAFREAGELVPTFVAIRDAETLHAHRQARLFPDRRADYGALTASRLEAATAVGLDQYLEASARRAALGAAMADLFAAIDVLMLPLALGPAPAIEAPQPDEDAWELVHRSTVPFNLLGLPACCLRAGFDAQGLPIAVQIVGREGDDALVLAVAQQLWEATREVQLRWPALPDRPADQPGGAPARVRGCARETAPGDA